jgi:hypothetical protein
LLFAFAVRTTEALGEFLHATLGVQKALLTSPVRVNTAPNVNVNFGFGRECFHHNFAVVNDLARNQLRVNISLHKASNAQRLPTVGECTAFAAAVEVYGFKSQESTRKIAVLTQNKSRARA